MKTKEFDKKFDEGEEDILENVGEFKRTIKLAIELTEDVIDKIDNIANKADMSKEALIKTWIKEKLASI